MISCAYILQVAGEDCPGFVQEWFGEPLMLNGRSSHTMDYGTSVKHHTPVAANTFVYI